MLFLLVSNALESVGKDEFGGFLHVKHGFNHGHEWQNVFQIYRHFCNC